jgi:hypothetical protein
MSAIAYQKNVGGTRYALEIDRLVKPVLGAYRFDAKLSATPNRGTRASVPPTAVLHVDNQTQRRNHIGDCIAWSSGAEARQKRNLAAANSRADSLMRGNAIRLHLYVPHWQGILNDAMQQLPPSFDPDDRLRFQLLRAIPTPVRNGYGQLMRYDVVPDPAAPPILVGDTIMHMLQPLRTYRSGSVGLFRLDPAPRRA